MRSIVAKPTRVLAPRARPAMAVRPVRVIRTVVRSSPQEVRCDKQGLISANSPAAGCAFWVSRLNIY